MVPLVPVEAEGFTQGNVQELLEDPVHIDEKGTAGYLTLEQFHAGVLDD